MNPDFVGTKLEYFIGVGQRIILLFMKQMKQPNYISDYDLNR